jgi:hypothetical protein
VHRKHGPTQTDLAAEMMRRVAEWLPQREFWLVADGAYSRLLRLELPHTKVITRLRPNAARYELRPPRVAHQRGRPRKNGQRLPLPGELAASCQCWQPRKVVIRSRILTRELFCRRVLWYETCPEPVLMVVARNSDGVDDDLYLVTSDIDADPPEVVTLYGDRWASEETFRNLGTEDPQCWVGPGPERVVALAGWLYSAAWGWFLEHGDVGRTYWPERSWYPGKQIPSFADALAALRRQLWTARLFETTTPGEVDPEILSDLLEVLALAA